MEQLLEVLRKLADGVHGPQVHALIDAIEAAEAAPAAGAAPAAPAAPSLPAGARLPGK